MRDLLSRISLVLAMLLLGFLQVVAQDQSQLHATPAMNTQRIAKEVRHEILMLPYYDVFDNIGFKVEGYNVTLVGYVTNPAVKSDAGKAVKGIEGVEQVNNEIEVLPPSPMDNQIRLQVFRAIYGFGPLQKYDMPVIKPIRIIVKGGHVTLEGVVDNETDKNTAGIRAKTVPGTFSVTNNLQVVKPS
jgi:hyperosmotically inducible periplasmic protein